MVNSFLIDELKLKQSNVILHRVDYYNLSEFLQQIAKIWMEERKTNNEIFMNVSGGTMISIAGSLSAMYFGIRPYFLKKITLRTN